MEYSVKNHGDWLEKQASEFINKNLPAYELIWKNFIGHQGNGHIAEMLNISPDEDSLRINFSQHHYTILESLYFMQCIVDDISITNKVNSFDEYRRIIDQIMAYQAYSGRLRDNMEQCFIIIANQNEANSATERLSTFYQERHVFIHGRKVPFAFDEDKLFKIAPIKITTTSSSGYGKGMPWESINTEETKYLEDEMKKSINDLKPIVNGLLSHLFSFVKKFIDQHYIQLCSPEFASYDCTPPSGSTSA
jgi:hypothetical protein